MDFLQACQLYGDIGDMKMRQVASGAAWIVETGRLSGSAHMKASAMDYGQTKAFLQHVCEALQDAGAPITMDTAAKRVKSLLEAA